MYKNWRPYKISLTLYLKTGKIISTEMVVVEMTSEKPSYQFWKEGFFLLNNTYDKPFKTYEQMIALMESRNIIVEDKEFAITALQNLSYYGLINAYKNTFLQIPDSDDFINGTKFEELYTLHLLDVSLNSIIFKYILYLEKALKSRISYLVSEKYGVFTDASDRSFSNPSDYLCKSNYTNSNRKRINILIGLKESIHQSRNNPSMQHYINHRNHIPAWILITNLSYGLTIEWYNILKSCDKESICNSFISSGILTIEETKEFMRKSLELTKEYRNKIAHGNRTFSALNLPQLPKKQLLTLSFNTIIEEEYNSKMGQNDVMAVLLALNILLNDQYVLRNFYEELYSLLSPYANQDTHFNTKNVFEVFGFPNDLFSRLNNLFERRFL